jgi:hypothetical protein
VTLLLLIVLASWVTAKVLLLSFRAIALSQRGLRDSAGGNQCTKIAQVVLSGKEFGWAGIKPRAVLRLAYFGFIQTDARLLPEFT